MRLQRVLREIAEGDILVQISFYSFCLSSPLYSLPASLFRLNFLRFFYALFSEHLLSLSWLVSGFVVLGRYWWGKGLLLLWGSKKSLKIRLVSLCFSLLVSFVLPLPSVFFSTLCSSVLLGLYRARRVDNGRQAEGRPPLRRPLLKPTDDDYCCNVRRPLL